MQVLEFASFVHKTVMNGENNSPELSALMVGSLLIFAQLSNQVLKEAVEHTPAMILVLK